MVAALLLIETLVSLVLATPANAQAWPPETKADVVLESRPDAKYCFYSHMIDNKTYAICSFRTRDECLDTSLLDPDYFPNGPPGSIWAVCRPIPAR